LRVSSPQGRFGVDASALDGRAIHRVEAYGKHLFQWWDDGSVVHIHLGLFGRFRWLRTGDPDPPTGAVRMRIVGPAVALDLSGPTACERGTAALRDAIVERLGPDPLRADAEPKRFIDRAHRSPARIATLLMDQSVIAGVGNVYRAEALYLRGIDPDVRGRDLSIAELEGIWTTVVDLLADGVRRGRIVTVDPAERDPSSLGRRRGEATYVYHRATCLRCAGPVTKVDLQGRWCYSCPTCQPARSAVHGAG